jgi:hypothetical protein
VLHAWYDEKSDDPAVVTTAEELDAVLDAVAALDGPTLVQLFSGGDDAEVDLTVGLHGDRGVLRFASNDAEDAFYSRNSTEPFPLPAWGVVRYYYMSNDADYPDDAELPAEMVRAAAHEFARTAGQRPSNLSWSQRAW